MLIGIDLCSPVPNEFNSLNSREEKMTKNVSLWSFLTNCSKENKAIPTYFSGYLTAQLYNVTAYPLCKGVFVCGYFTGGIIGVIIFKPLEFTENKINSFCSKNFNYFQGNYKVFKHNTAIIVAAALTVFVFIPCVIVAYTINILLCPLNLFFSINL